MSCYVCGGKGQGLNEKVIICKECNWLRPLVPGYQVDSSTFEWAADGAGSVLFVILLPKLLPGAAMNHP